MVNIVQWLEYQFVTLQIKVQTLFFTHIFKFDKMMAQKINSLSFRLNNRYNWSTIINTHNFNDYFNQIINTNKLQTIKKNIFFSLRSMNNVLTISKTSKAYKVNCKLINQMNYFELVKLICTSKRITQLFHRYQLTYFKLFKHMFTLYSSSKHQLIFRSGSINSNKLLKNQYLVFYPLLITQFVTSQLTNTNIINLTGTNFNNTLQTNILKLIKLLLVKFNYKIIGFKVICVGKWKKTKTGRKQKIYFKFGQIQTANIANKIYYHSTAQKTKFGVCSIKIWILHRK